MAKTIIDADIVRGPLYRAWDAIAGDLMAGVAECGERLTNAGCVEACIDANRMTFFARGATERAAAEAAEREVSRAVDAHGYVKVLRALSRAFRLI